MIRAFIETSLIDWDGKITSVLFFDKCNFRCPFCQNWRLLTNPEKFPEYDIDEIFKKILKKKNWVDGIVLTGGEPLLFFEDVIEIVETARKNNLKIKLDTNGSLPEQLKNLLTLKLVDYVAMDIKAPLDETYFTATGKKSESFPDLLDRIRESIKFLMASNIDYEFRTTCVPGLIDEKSIEKIGMAIKGARLWALQRFISINAYKKEYRNKNFDERRLDEFLKIARSIIPNTILR
ncbi:MAG: anaerobic ribonucleoside-triphosphate reductase activating protein [candidate division WOR-3 bacterium]|nr:anaerobic ribonucleoside-triphosphate reductase activating protein [candidate division WOR-3 bacterium]